MSILFSWHQRQLISTHTWIDINCATKKSSIAYPTLLCHSRFDYHFSIDSAILSCYSWLQALQQSSKDPCFWSLPTQSPDWPTDTITSYLFFFSFFFVTLHDQTSTEGKKVQNSFSTAIMLCDQQLCLIFGEELSIPLEFKKKKKKWWYSTFSTLLYTASDPTTVVVAFFTRICFLKHEIEIWSNLNL